MVIHILHCVCSLVAQTEQFLSQQVQNYTSKNQLLHNVQHHQAMAVPCSPQILMQTQCACYLSCVVWVVNQLILVAQIGVSSLMFWLETVQIVIIMFINQQYQTVLEIRSQEELWDIIMETLILGQWTYLTTLAVCTVHFILVLHQQHKMMFLSLLLETILQPIIFVLTSTVAHSI